MVDVTCVHVAHAIPTLVFVKFYFILVKCFEPNKHKIHHVHNALKIGFKIKDYMYPLITLLVLVVSLGIGFKCGFLLVS